MIVRSLLKYVRGVAEVWTENPKSTIKIMLIMKSFDLYLFSAPGRRSLPLILSKKNYRKILGDQVRISTSTPLVVNRKRQHHLGDLAHQRTIPP